MLVDHSLYAVHYARVTATVGGLTFPGDAAWSSGIASISYPGTTTSHPSYVEIEQPDPQDCHRSHALAFRLNTVILALLMRCSLRHN